MPTHLIIDGYNVLGKRGQVGPNSDMAREQFVQELAIYRQRKGHAITVVFDGWKQGFGSERHEHRGGVEVVYSKRGEQADQVIGRLAAEFSRSCAVVSSDHEVQRFARAHEAFVISASEFEARLRERAPSNRSTRSDDKDEESSSPKRNAEKKGNGRKLPKKLRRRNQQLKGF
ncbi:MAG TPA: NYN domain-containing protein [Nitrospiraceae bacterium]|nr:NYN domain-containing protein [Nitrospiraceae bacterium]